MKKFVLSTFVLITAFLTTAFTSCREEKKENMDIPVAVTGVTFDKSDITLEIGKELTLGYTVVPEKATNKDVKWESDHPNVVTVSNGKLTAKATGTAKITVITWDGDFKDDCNVTVTPIPVSGVMIGATTLKLVAGMSEYAMTYSIVPENAGNKEVTWSSDNHNVAVVNETGEIKALSEGTAKITVTTKDGGFKSSCELNVLFMSRDLGLKDYISMIRPDFKIGFYHILWPIDSEIPNQIFKKDFNYSSLGIFMNKTQKTLTDWDLGFLNEQDFRLSTLKNIGITDIGYHHLYGWNIYNPPWFTEETFTSQELETILDSRAKYIFDKYGTDMLDMHVINESFPGGNWRDAKDDQWTNLGFVTGWNGYNYPKYLGLGFEKSRLYGGRNVKLIYNDNNNSMYGMTGGNYKSVQNLNLFKNFKELGIPIDGVGLQCHFAIEPTGKVYEGTFEVDYSKITQQMNELGKLGAIVQITECDITLPSAIYGDNYLEIQAKAYLDIFKTCFENPHCNLFQLWYLNDVNTPDGKRSGFFDADWNPKPAYFAILDYLYEKACEKIIE